jgi:biotin operon repressor
MTTRERAVLLSIPVGRKNAVRRYTLSMALNIPDRSLRNIIEGLQNQGYQIINFQNGEGYFLAETPEEVLHYRAQERKRGRSLIDKARRIKYRPDIREQIERLRAGLREGG